MGAVETDDVEDFVKRTSNGLTEGDVAARAEVEARFSDFITSINSIADNVIRVFS